MDYSVAVTVTSSVEGVIIPPSQNMLFYALASASGISISTLLICGYVPGILLTLGLMIPAYAIAMQKKYPLGEKHSLKENVKIVTEAVLGLGAIVIVIAGTSLASVRPPRQRQWPQSMPWSSPWLHTGT